MLNGRSAIQPIGGSCNASLDVKRERGRAGWCGLDFALAASGGAERPLEGETGCLELGAVSNSCWFGQLRAMGNDYGASRCARRA
jgi:hypothetical protein